MPQTLPNAIAWWARMRGDQPAVVLAGETLTYRDYHDWSGRVAAMLIADGLEPGDRVAIYSANSLSYVALIMGTIRAGGIVNPVSSIHSFHCRAKYGRSASSDGTATCTSASITGPVQPPRPTPAVATGTVAVMAGPGAGAAPGRAPPRSRRGPAPRARGRA